jgi:hypothetical protein
VQYLERALVSRDVELITRGALERAAAIRPDLRCDAERAQEAERATGDRRLGEVEMHGDLAASS